MHRHKYTIDHSNNLKFELNVSRNPLISIEVGGENIVLYVVFNAALEVP